MLSADSTTVRFRSSRRGGIERITREQSCPMLSADSTTVRFRSCIKCGPDQQPIEIRHEEWQLRAPKTCECANSSTTNATASGWDFRVSLIRHATKYCQIRQTQPHRGTTLPRPVKHQRRSAAATIQQTPLGQPCQPCVRVELKTEISGSPKLHRDPAPRSGCTRG